MSINCTKSFPALQRNVPSAKKSKPEPAAKSGASGKDKDKDPEWSLDKNRVVKVRSFKGKAYIDIREYYLKDGEMLPGKKGISLSPVQWKKLLENVDEINKAVENV